MCVGGGGGGGGLEGSYGNRFSFSYHVGLGDQTQICQAKQQAPFPTRAAYGPSLLFQEDLK